jgi:hypothetical protein
MLLHKPNYISRSTSFSLIIKVSSYKSSISSNNRFSYVSNQDIMLLGLYILTTLENHQGIYENQNHPYYCDLTKIKHQYKKVRGPIVRTLNFTCNSWPFDWIARPHIKSSQLLMQVSKRGCII